MHTHFHALSVVLACAVGLLTKPAIASAQEHRPPHILWIVSEDNGPFLGCYGDERAHTPNLDRLAADGVRYTLAFANAPVCAPSRCSIITGIYASSLGTLHMRSTYAVPGSVPFFPQLLRGAGYHCTNPGKTDYNIANWPRGMWDKGNWTKRVPGQPFFSVVNLGQSHESCLHGTHVRPELLTRPFRLPAYHPDTPEIRSNWVEYYEKISVMDARVGEVLDALDRQGLADDTIVFYYSDHAGILPRSKRFVYDSGLRVPLIVRFGKNVRHLAPAEPGAAVDRVVTLMDLGPTVLSLAGLETPAMMHGRAFLGDKAAPPVDYAFAFRGRMDGTTGDLSYALRDRRYRYIRNFMPHRVYGQHLPYLWKMPATVSWERAFNEGRCDAKQSAFWLPKPTEELYDLQADRDEVNNLADDPAHRDTLVRLRAALRAHLLLSRDVGLLPESHMLQRAEPGTIYDMAQDPSRYPVERILGAAELATDRAERAPSKLLDLARDSDPALRYWAAIGLVMRPAMAREHEDLLRRLAADDCPAVRVPAAEAMCLIGREDHGLKVLVQSLESGDTALAANALVALGERARPAAELVVEAWPRLRHGPYLDDQLLRFLELMDVATPAASTPERAQPR